MNMAEVKSLLGKLCREAAEACDVAKTATRNNKALSGDNFYGNKFHGVVVALSTTETKVRPILKHCDLEKADLEVYEGTLSLIKSAEAKPTQRAEALKQLRLLCESTLIPKIEGMGANSVPATEQVLPMSVVQGTRGYLERVILQANGCYEHQWFDACSVMIRRFVETLVIEVYEAKSQASEIKGTDGNFLMLSQLVDRIIASPAWNLGRETKTGLPLIKSLGDRSAHNRYFLARKQDIDPLLSR